jgi:hypothetical protein
MKSWLIKESIKKYLKPRHDYNNRKENKENYDDDDDDNNQLPASKKRKKNSMNYIANFLQKKII